LGFEGAAPDCLSRGSGAPWLPCHRLYGRAAGGFSPPIGLLWVSEPSRVASHWRAHTEIQGFRRPRRWTPSVKPPICRSARQLRASKESPPRPPAGVECACT
jgi:hypothetical protein